MPLHDEVAPPGTSLTRARTTPLALAPIPGILRERHDGGTGAGMASRYTFTEYSPEWPARFAREAERLGALLGEELVGIHHIGSTSVPGLAAKPIIDLLPLVRDLTRMDEHNAKLQAAGYQAWGECGLPGRRYFTRDHDGYRTHNIHIYQVDDPQVDRHLAFCAYLREHEGARREYEALKRQVYALHPDDIAAYNHGKDAWIKQLEQLALPWYRQRKEP
ncbi:MAG: GrpB family protein [Myxococcota bacterium]